MSVMMLMKERIAIPMFFPASAASSSSWATFLTSYKLDTITIQKALTKFLLDVIPELPQRRPELHHVLRDGVEVLESAVDVA